MTATAHKLARIIYHVLRTKQAYDETVFAKWEESANRQEEMHLLKQPPNSDFRLCPKKQKAWHSGG